VALFAQTLWGEVQKGNRSPLNGFAEASYTLVAALSILALNSIPLGNDYFYLIYLFYTIYLYYFRLGQGNFFENVI
jgi:hypothetical protein